MPTAQSVSPSPSPSPSPAAAAAEASNHWAPHGLLLTACLVGLNVLMILLIFFYFWRFFSGKGGPASPVGADEASSSADTSPASFPRASWRQRCGGLDQQPDIAASLPVSVYSSSSSDDAGAAGAKAADCAVCIVEFRAGDLARLLPRCGHRFHAACVDAWLRLHATCPLCRAAVVAPAAATPPPKNNDPKNAVAAAAEEECPV